MKVVAIGALLASLCFSTAAFSGQTTGTISELMILSDLPDKVFVRVTGTNSHPVACNTQNNRYVLDAGTSTGKQVYAALLAAKHASATVTLFGFDNCGLYNDSETLRGIAQN